MALACLLQLKHTMSFAKDDFHFNWVMGNAKVKPIYIYIYIYIWRKMHSWCVNQVVASS
jgi:hypothetical protein